MSTKGKIPTFVNIINCNRERLTYNARLLDIFQGNLLHYVKEALKKQLGSQESYNAAESRIPPINVLRRVIDKLSKIYSQPPQRTVTKDSDSDSQEALDWYVKEMMADQRLSLTNEYFNLFKNALVEPYLGRNARPCLRVIASSKFIPYVDDEMNDVEFPDGFLIPICTKQKPYIENGKKGSRAVEVWKAVDADDFTFFDSDGDDVTAQYLPNNPEGINELGRIPYVYINREPNSIQPTLDTDTYAMTVLIPLLLTDINFAHMFQAFCVIYGINVNFQKLSYSPNAFWEFKTEPGSDQKPEVGVIKPQADIDMGLKLVMTQFAFWLQSKGIKPGSIGSIDGAEAAQNGISKIIDEMDTSDDRKAQVPFFKEAEERQLWDLIFNAKREIGQVSLHEIWMRDPSFEYAKPILSPVKVDVKFAEQIPLVKRLDVINEVEKELGLGLTTKLEAIARLNPLLTEEQVEERLKQAQIEITPVIEEPADDQTGGAA